jgi:hypothetical protein
MRRKKLSKDRFSWMMKIKVLNLVLETAAAPNTSKDPETESSIRIKTDEMARTLRSLPEASPLALTAE